MNTPRFSRWAGFLSVAALAGAVWWAQIGLGRERGENLQLREAVGEAQAQQEQQEQITQLRAQAALLETLRAESREAARLRGGLAQLRSEAAERQRLQTENQRLEAQGTNKVGLWARLAAQPGFVPAASFAEAGLATAEGALRSWFNALHQNDFRRAAECMVPKAAAAMAGEIDRYAVWRCSFCTSVHQPRTWCAHCGWNTWAYFATFTREDYQF